MVTKQWRILPVMYHWEKSLRLWTTVELSQAKTSLPLFSTTDDSTFVSFEFVSISLSFISYFLQAREKHFSYGVNKKSLHAIEKAAFVLVLDDEEFDIQDTESSAVTASARSLLHGNCYNRLVCSLRQCLIKCLSNLAWRVRQLVIIWRLSLWLLTDIWINDLRTLMFTILYKTCTF